MSYGLIYTIPFATIYNISCVVEIEKENYSGEVTELKGGASPFTVDIADDEFLYVPIRFSTATIRIVGSDYLQSLFTTAYQEYRVVFKKNGINDNRQLTITVKEENYVTNNVVITVTKCANIQAFK